MLILEEKPHARLSASASKRWLSCPGSGAAVPPHEGDTEAGGDRTAAAEGTYAHEIARLCVLSKGNVRPADFIGRKALVFGLELTCTEEMAEAVDVYVETALEDIPTDGWRDVHLEADVSAGLRKLHPALGGSADLIYYGRTRDPELLVTDYKHGSGVYVEERGNTQLLTYAVGACMTFGLRPRRVELRIVQPRFIGFPAVRSDTVEWDELAGFANKLKSGAEAALELGAEIRPGPHCRSTFCPHARTCPALEAMQHALIEQDFGPITNVQTVATALDMVEPLKAKIHELERFAYELATRGAEIPGWKLVQKRPVRRIVDEHGVLEWAARERVDPWERTLLSPAKLEAAYAENAPRGKRAAFERAAREALTGFVSSESSGLVLVPASDKREGTRQISVDDFDALPAPPPAGEDWYG